MSDVKFITGIKQGNVIALTRLDYFRNSHRESLIRRQLYVINCKLRRNHSWEDLGEEHSGWRNKSE